MDSLYTTRASKNHAFCPHIFSILYSLRTISGVKLQLQLPRGPTCARKLRYTGFTIVQLDTQFFTISFERREVLNGRSWRSKIKNTFFFLSIFLKFFISFIYLCISIDTYTPSNQHFKAFLVSTFNSETSFLYQLFKENSNFIGLILDTVSKIHKLDYEHQLNNFTTFHQKWK